MQASGMGMALTDFRAMKNYLAVTVVVFLMVFITQQSGWVDE